MKRNFILSLMLGSILLLGIFGLFNDDAFAQNPSLNDDDFKAEERQKELEQKKAEQKEKAEERQKELEQKKAELAINRENLEAKQLKKFQQYEEKLKEIKEKK